MGERVLVAQDSLVENGDTAKRSTDPFCIVQVEFGIYGVEEGAYEGHFQGRALDRAFVLDVADCFEPISNVAQCGRKETYTDHRGRGEGTAIWRLTKH